MSDFEYTDERDRRRKRIARKRRDKQNLGKQKLNRQLRDARPRRRDWSDYGTVDDGSIHTFACNHDDDGVANDVCDICGAPIMVEEEEIEGETGESREDGNGIQETRKLLSRRGDDEDETP